MPNENLEILLAKVKKAKRVYLAGNGGSWANSVHICNDLIACGIKAYTIDPATLTAIANDHGYAFVFERWLNVVGEAGDLLIALSGSGTSANILRAVEIAKKIGMDVHCEFGADQGWDMQTSEERQIWLGHEMMRALKT